MRPCLLIFTGLLACTASAAQAQGLLLPEDKALSPLALVRHQVHIAIDEQVATTKVDQTFRNPTDRQLEATYVFPVPKGASVNEFAMWIDGKKVSGEMLKAADARQTYNEIVRRTQDPGLLEYVSNNLMRLRVFPIAPHADQKVTLSFTSVALQDAGAIEYVYPLKVEGRTAPEDKEFTLETTITSKHAVQNVYSPSHDVHVKRHGDREVTVTCERSRGHSERDFQLFYSLGDKDVGLTALTYRPVSDEDGHFLMLLSPKVELARNTVIPRDVVLVLDTSGSMRGVKMEQARKALKYCLKNLNHEDRFAVINFASTVNQYRDHLVASSSEQVESALKWVDRLEATGGTAIDAALQSALEMRSSEKGRTFTIVFFTDGQPTDGECDPEKIVKHVLAKKSANTRIFTFGVGDDVNATLLDQLADQTRAVSTFVRPSEDIEAKASALYDKVSQPVLADLKLKVGSNVQLAEVYPPQLPDLFHGGQLVVLGRYHGHGAATVTLTGTVGKESKEFVYEMTFPKKSGDAKSFVEQLWARRKVGYLLDQIRANGEKKELVDEVMALAKKHGIATPYTSYLIVPDGTKVAQGQPVPVQTMVPMPGGQGGAVYNGVEGYTRQQLGDASMNQMSPAAPTSASPVASPAAATSTREPYRAWGNATHMNFAGAGSAPVPASKPSAGAPAPQPVADIAGEEEEEERADASKLETKRMRAVGALKDSAGKAPADKKAQVYAEALQALRSGNREGYQAGQVGVELSIEMDKLRNQSRMEAAAVRHVAGHDCLEVSGVWIDQAFDAKMKMVEVKAMSAAYFRLMERHSEVTEVFQLGSRLVWVTPSGTALVIDTGRGKETMSDDEIDKLFVAVK
jgi:Ca-activated chloride channel homolog